MLGGLLIVLYSSSDVAVFILLTSLLTFLVSLSLSSTFALTYLLTSGFISGIIVIFKSLVVVMQINFTLALSFAAAQYIFVSVFTPSGAINLLVQLPTKLILLTLIFLHSNSVIPTLLSLLFLSLATFATSMRILFLLGSTAQVPSLLNLFFLICPMPPRLIFLWYGAILVLIFVTVESGLTSLLGFTVIVGLPLTLPLLLKFILLSFGESLVSLGLIVPWILSGSVLGS